MYNYKTDVTRITQYTTVTSSQRHHFDVSPSDYKVVNVYFLSEGIESERDTLILALNLRFPVLMFKEVVELDFSKPSQQPTIIVKRKIDNDNMARFPAELLKHACVLELFSGRTPMTDDPPRSKTRVVTINGINVEVFVFYMVLPGKLLPQYTDDSNEISFSDLSEWLGYQLGLDVYISLPYRLSKDPYERDLAETYVYTDPEEYETLDQPVSQAQEFSWNDFPSSPSQSEASFSRDGEEQRDSPFSPLTPYQPTSSQNTAPSLYRGKRSQPSSTALAIKKLDFDSPSDSESSGSEFFSSEDDLSSSSERQRAKYNRIDALL
jgi:hypothetical protein